MSETEIKLALLNFYHDTRRLLDWHDRGIETTAELLSDLRLDVEELERTIHTIYQEET